MPQRASPSNEELRRRSWDARAAWQALAQKQARNLWQCMGVTQYEIPLDSRIADWVRSLPSSFEMDPQRRYAGIA